MEKTITQKYLENLGWKRDLTCPEGVNRWENKNPHECTVNEWWSSVTFSDASGTIPIYGVMNFHGPEHDIIIHRAFERDIVKNKTRISYGHLHQKCIEGCLTISDFEKMMDKDYK